MIEALAHAGIPTIPVRVHEDRWRKRPLAEWDQATTDCETLAHWQRRWPEALPGIPLERVGWAVIDIDDYNDAAFRAAWIKPEKVMFRRGRPVREPEHYSIYATPSGGRHIVFAQCDPPIAGRMRWSEGVEVLGIGTLLTVHDWNAILYPRVAQRAVLPEVFRKPYVRPMENPINKEERVAPPVPPERGASAGAAVDVASLTEALFKLDVTEWRGEHDAWLSLANACKFEGVSEDDFVAWSLQDEMYRRDEGLIRRKWHSLTPRHGGALWAALAAHSIKVRRGTSTVRRGMVTARSASFIDEVPHGATERAGLSSRPPALPDLRDQSRNLIAWLNAAPSEDRLFRVACVFAERGMVRDVALSVLKSNCAALRRALGPEEFARSIDNAFRHVEEKQNVEATA
jgi:Bifunctional DNA primase/polymerase, N-terminal/Primase C terminal 2 (PriCT-2)